MKLVLGRIFLVIALLAGWQAALVHPVEHVDEAGALVHVGDRDGDHGSASGELCDVLSALSACASSALVLFHAERAAGVLPLQARFEPRRAQAPPFLSQGPPTFL